LLIKYLFPSQALSVQVHPDDDYARTHEQGSGKTEMWLVLSAAHKSFIILGWAPGLTKQDIVKELEAGNFRPVLRTIRPKPGDVYFIPSGTVHALGPGVSVLEIQQNSDITYRLYDWDRLDKTGTPRQLHVGKALDVLDFEPSADHRIQPIRVMHETGSCEYLCACRYFAVCRWDLNKKTEFVSDPSRFWVLNVIAGQGSLEWPDADPIWLEQGVTLLIPAQLGKFSVDPSGPLSLIKSWLPELGKDIVHELRSAGIPDADILALGGPGPGNDLRDILRA
jgi:mannose-6-phosphate isomerase